MNLPRRKPPTAAKQRVVEVSRNSSGSFDLVALLKGGMALQPPFIHPHWSFASPGRFAARITRPVHDDPPVNFCGRCSRRFRGVGTFCESCRQIEDRAERHKAGSKPDTSALPAGKSSHRTEAGR
jgi:hypothetical protein